MSELLGQSEPGVGEQLGFITDNQGLSLPTSGLDTTKERQTEHTYKY